MESPAMSFDRRQETIDYLAVLYEHGAYQFTFIPLMDDEGVVDREARAAHAGERGKNTKGYLRILPHETDAHVVTESVRYPEMMLGNERDEVHELEP